MGTRRSNSVSTHHSVTEEQDSLDTQLEQANRELEAIEKQVSLEEVRNRIQQRQSDLAALKQPPRGTVIPTLQDTPTEPATTLSRESGYFRGSKIPKLTTKGNSHPTPSDVTLFLHECEGYFELGRSDLAADKDRILVAQQGLDTASKKRWLNYLQRTNQGLIDGISWLEFIDWLKSTLPDESTRDLAASSKLAEARQTENETVQSFADRIEELEGELLEPQSDRTRINNLVRGIKPWLKRQIIPQMPRIRTRSEFVSNCQLIEEALGVSYRNNRASSISSGTVDRSVSGHGDPLTAGEKRPRSDDSSCWTCGASGHYSRECTQRKRCRGCGGSGHTQPNCPEGTRTGANAAPLGASS